LTFLVTQTIFFAKDLQLFGSIGPCVKVGGGVLLLLHVTKRLTYVYNKADIKKIFELKIPCWDLKMLEL